MTMLTLLIQRDVDPCDHDDAIQQLEKAGWSVSVEDDGDADCGGDCGECETCQTACESCDQPDGFCS